VDVIFFLVNNLPRTYVFTILLTALITVILYRSIEFMRFEAYQLIAVVLMAFLILINEKTALFEDMICKRTRRFLGTLTLIAIMIVVVVFFFVLKTT
jgi:hypothetical protein